MTEPLLRVESLTKHFPVTRGVLGRVVGQVRAVDGVSFDVSPGETLGLVGESGCGKTTVGRTVLRLLDPTSGKLTFAGKDITRTPQSGLREFRKDVQIVFQDPYSSLNPRHRVADIVGEALEIHGVARGRDVDRRVAELLRRVGLSPSWMNRYPHEFSGGQRQRIGIARAIALHPKLVVCDEAVSALDVSIQAQVLNLLIELRREMGLAYLFIAHDLSVVRHVSHRIAVMYLGQIVELSPAKELFRKPAHPYTRALLASIPVPVPRREPRRLVLEGDVPSPLNPPDGCRFHTRCPAVMDRCRSEEPREFVLEPGHTAKCFHAEGLEGDPEWSRAVDARIEERMRVVQAEAAAVSRTAGTLPPRAALNARRATGTETRAEPRVQLPTGRRVLGAVAAGVAAFVIGSHSMKARTAVRQMRALRTEIDEHARLTGALPATLDDLGWRLYPLFHRGRPDDPWGHPYVYEQNGGGASRYALVSRGPDGIPSSDDLGDVPKSGKMERKP